MGALIDLFVTNTEVLTPAGLFEIFGFFMVIEFIGMMFSWIRGVK